MVGTGTFDNTYCYGRSGEPFWLDWGGGRFVCGISGPEVYRIVMYAGLFLGLAVLVLARRRTDHRFWVRCGVAVLMPFVAYGALRLVVAVS